MDEQAWKNITSAIFLRTSNSNVSSSSSDVINSNNNYVHKIQNKNNNNVQRNQLWTMTGRNPSQRSQNSQNDNLNDHPTSICENGRHHTMEKELGRQHEIESFDELDKNKNSPETTQRHFQSKDESVSASVSADGLFRKSKGRSRRRKNPEKYAENASRCPEALFTGQQEEEARRYACDLQSGITEIFTLDQLLAQKSSIIRKQAIAIEALNKKLASFVPEQLRAPEHQVVQEPQPQSHPDVPNPNPSVLESQLKQLETKLDHLMEDLPKQIETQLVQILQAYEQSRAAWAPAIPKWKQAPLIKPKSNVCSNYRLQSLHGSTKCVFDSEDSDQVELKISEMEKIVDNLKNVCLVLLIKFGKMQ